MSKKIISTKKGKDGNIESVKFEGNSTYTKTETAIRMADNGNVSNAHVVHEKNGTSYLRSNPDNKKGNNLDEMAE